MVPKILFFGSRILTPQYFWLITLCNCLKSSCASFGEKKLEIGMRRFCANQHKLAFSGGAEKNVLPLKSHRNKNVQILCNCIHFFPVATAMGLPPDFYFAVILQICTKFMVCIIHISSFIINLLQVNRKLFYSMNKNVQNYQFFDLFLNKRICTLKIY